MWLLFVCVVSVAAHESPNFVLFLTDDQDVLLDGMKPMEKTLALIAKKGVYFDNMYVNSPVCCPSRSTLLVGKYMHNTGVNNNSLSGNCSSESWQKHHEPFSIASLLKTNKNYTTFYAGKYLNQYGAKQCGGTKHVPKGYDWWIGLKGNSRYYNYTLSLNGTAKNYSNQYLTDVINDFALEFLNQNLVTQSPFFMMVAPPAPHAPYTPAPRHSKSFPNAKAVRTPSFNYTPVEKHWLVNMPPKYLPQNVTILDEIQRHRMQTLLSVDEMVENVLCRLKKLGILHNTYVLFLSDNGFHIGQFTQPWDKRQPYETDIKVPFLIRGPKIKRKQTNFHPISMVDIAPTILDLAEVEVPESMDGRSFKNQLFKKASRKVKSRNLFIEYSGETNPKTIDAGCQFGDSRNLSECFIGNWCKCQDARNNTYNCLLHFKGKVKFKYCEFDDDLNFIEAYDLREDPNELRNLATTMEKSLQKLYKKGITSFKRCAGVKCK